MPNKNYYMGLFWKGSPIKTHILSPKLIYSYEIGNALQSAMFIVLGRPNLFGVEVTDVLKCVALI